MKQRIELDVSALPTYGFGPKGSPWWGAMGFIALEGMGFALAAGAYLYLMAVNPNWPLDAPPGPGGPQARGPAGRAAVRRGRRRRRGRR